MNEESFSSVTSILQPTVLDSLYWKPEAPLENHGWSWAKLSDPAGSFDAYLWEVQRLNILPDGSIDPVVYKPFNPYFNDDFFDGLTFDFAYENPINFFDEDVDEAHRGYYAQGDTILVTLSKLGQAEYNFFEKKYNQMYTAGNPFATPTNIPSNIEGGALGIGVSQENFMFSRTAGNFMTKATAVVATLFIICSLGLTIISRGDLVPTSSVLDTVEEKIEDTPAIPENNN